MRFLIGYTFLLVYHFRLFLFNGSLIFLLRNVLIVLVDHLIGRSVDLEMFQIKASYELFASQLKSLFCYFVKLFIMLDDFLDMDFEFGVQLFWINTCLARQVMDNTDDFGEDFWSALLHKCHEVLNFFLLGLVDDHLVAFVHVEVELLGELAVIKKGVIDFDEAIILIFGLFVFPQEFGNVLVSLEIVIFQLFQPFLSLLDADLFHMEKVV